jgi:hypothetical protein
MALGQHKRAVGAFPRRRDAEVALRELRDSNFPMDKVSVITRDADQQGNIGGTEVREKIGNKADEGATAGAITGGTLGGVTGLLVGLGSLLLPGIGPIMLAGATATALATTLAGTAIGAAAGSLLGGLIGLGIPEERAIIYNDRVSRGDYLVIVEGTDDDIRRAEAILNHHGIEEWGVYNSPGTAAVAATTPRRALVHNKRAIGIFPQRRDAEAALDDLTDAGFPLGQVSLIAREYDRHDRYPGLTYRDRFDNTSFRLPEQRGKLFHDRFNRGEYLVVVDGTEDEVRRAEPILRRHRIQDWDIFDIRDEDRSRMAATTPVAAGAAGAAAAPSRGVGRTYRAVGVFPHRRNAEAALTDLRDSRFNMDHVSIVGKNLDPNDQIAGADVGTRATGNKADEGAKGGAATGGILGGLGGLLVGLGALAIPGVGPVIAGGALATALATTAAGGAIGAAAGGLTGALVGLGIPEERAKFYNDRVNHGDYLVMVDGSEDEIRRAEPILRRHGIQDWGLFDKSDVSAVGTPDRGRDVDQHRTGHSTPVAAGAAGTAAAPSRGVGRTYRAVGVFPHRRNAEAALTDLRDSRFNMDHVSIVGKNLDPNDQIAGADVGTRATGNKADEGAKGGAATGGILGGLGGLLVGLGALAIPGVGPVIAGGALATALATTAAGGAIGAAAGGLTGALVGLGIPEERAKFYNDRVNHGDYLVMVDGSEDEIRRAEPILRRHGIQDWGLFDKSDVSASGTPERGHDVDRTGYATRNVIDHDTTPGVDTTRRDAKVVSDHPEVIIIDHRNQTP